MDNDAFLAGVLVFVGLFIGLVIGYIAGVHRGESDVECRAVKAGAAHYVAHENGSCRFEFIKPEVNNETTD